MPSHRIWVKFILLCLLLMGYFAYLSYEYNILTGGVTAALTWSFFVLCTPIADAGFLLDFPLRLLFGVRMVLSEIVVWILAISLNIYAYFDADTYYRTTALTRVFYHILSTPIPYWSVIFLSAIGTFLSVRFGDELLDVVHHHERDFFHSHKLKYYLIITVFFGLLVLTYYKLIASLNISILL
ncbi:MAG: hypothetical protein H6908_05340 [Hyphomicrobiales bacterium]|nr:hypothetical protein [Hyphomicrobiales bacterium]